MAYYFILMVAHVEGSNSSAHARDDVTSDAQLP